MRNLTELICDYLIIWARGVEDFFLVVLLRTTSYNQPVDAELGEIFTYLIASFRPPTLTTFNLDDQLAIRNTKTPHRARSDLGQLYVLTRTLKFEPSLSSPFCALVLSSLSSMAQECGPRNQSS